MPWVKIDDGFHDHPKVKMIGLDGAGLLVSLTTWSSRHLTDGIVPEQVIRDMCGHHRTFNTLLTRLIKAKCLRRCPGGTTKRYIIHDYLDYNDSADVVKARRAAEREKKRRQRGGSSGESPEGCPPGTTKDTESMSRRPRPVPSRPKDLAVGLARESHGSDVESVSNDRADPAERNGRVQAHGTEPDSEGESLSEDAKRALAKTLGVPYPVEDTA